LYTIFISGTHVFVSNSIRNLTSKQATKPTATSLSPTVAPSKGDNTNSSNDDTDAMEVEYTRAATDATLALTQSLTRLRILYQQLVAASEAVHQAAINEQCAVVHQHATDNNINMDDNPGGSVSSTTSSTSDPSTSTTTKVKESKGSRRSGSRGSSSSSSRASTLRTVVAPDPYQLYQQVNQIVTMYRKELFVKHSLLDAIQVQLTHLAAK
jgi:hypothetical protein